MKCGGGVLGVLGVCGGGGMEVFDKALEVGCLTRR